MERAMVVWHDCASTGRCIIIPDTSASMPAEPCLEGSRVSEKPWRKLRRSRAFMNFAHPNHLELFFFSSHFESHLSVSECQDLGQIDLAHHLISPLNVISALHLNFNQPTKAVKARIIPLPIILHPPRQVGEELQIAMTMTFKWTGQQTLQRRMPDVR